MDAMLLAYQNTATDNLILCEQLDRAERNCAKLIKAAHEVLECKNAECVHEAMDRLRAALADCE